MLRKVALTALLTAPLLKTGVKALVNVALTYMGTGAGK